MKRSALVLACLMFALIIAPVAAPATPYPGTNLDVIAHKIDYVNIGYPSSETGHNLYGWGRIEPKATGGGWGGGGFDGDCRVISSGFAGIHDGVENNLKDWASFTMDFGSDLSLGNKYLLLKSLEGHAKDSFYVYIDTYDDTKGYTEAPNDPTYYWAGDDITAEWWVLHDISIDLTGIHTIYLVSDQPHWSGWGTYGQVAFTWAATESREITAIAGTTITLDAMAKDRLATITSMTWSPMGPTFTVPYGTTTITITATDSAGDTASKQITVIGTPPIATIDLTPDTLNLKSNGKWVTAYIELPGGLNPADIDLSSVTLDSIPAVTDTQYSFVTDPTVYLIDHNGNGILERMVKFDRSALKTAVSSPPDLDSAPKFYDVPLTITGQLDGIPFEGTDTITVIKK